MTLPKNRKRVHAFRRGSDGSAFQKCESCGVSVAIALLDMHECKPNKDAKVKRFKGVSEKPKEVALNAKQSFDDQPRAPFHFFMESFMKSCNDENAEVESNRKGVEVWKKMSDEERKPYVAQAEIVDAAYQKKLLQEVEDMFKVDMKAHSALSETVDQLLKSSKDYAIADSDSHGCYKYSGFESLDTYQWEMIRPWIVGDSDSDFDCD